MRLTLALIACLVTPLAAETRQHGNVIFDMPRGWQTGATRDDGTLILRSELPDDKCEYCVIYITPGARATGRADTWVAGQNRRFIDEDDAPEPGPLDGLYWGFSTYWTMGLDGMMSMQLDHQFLTFWPDGRFYEGTPPQGLSGFDPAPSLDAGDMSWGSYRVDGDSVALFFANGETAELSMADETLVRGDATLYEVGPLADGTKVDGSLSTFFYSGFTPGSGLEGGVSASSYTKFNPDGTWSQDRSGGASAGFVDGAGTTTGGFATGSEGSDAGRYEVRDGLMIRTANDGTAPEPELIFKVGNDIMIGTLTLASGAEK